MEYRYSSKMRGGEIKGGVLDILGEGSDGRKDTMTTTDQIPENCRPYFGRMVQELVRMFTEDKKSGEVILRFQNGVPVEIEQVQRLHRPIKLTS